jgi:hypothetical protein
MIQTEVFRVGDLVRPCGSRETLIIRDVELYHGVPTYLVEEPTSMLGRSLGACWATQDELQPIEKR